MKSLFSTLVLAVIMISGCSVSPQYNDPIPEHDSFIIQSENVKEPRVINVWTPPQYAQGDNPLPVLYMPDGGIKEDFPHIANTLAELIKTEKIPPFILVGIENTVRTRDLTGYTKYEEDKEVAEETGESSNFRAFINEELIPYINENYKPKAQKGIIGESLAGLFVVETFMLNPSNFDYYIAFDPSLWWNKHDYDINAEKYLADFPKRETKIWIATSSAGGMSGAGHNLDKAFQNLSNENLIWKYSDEPKEKHHTIFRATKEKALIWTLN